MSKNSTFPGIKKRIIFHYSYCLLYSVEGRTSVGKNLLSGTHSFFKGIPVFFIKFCCHFIPCQYAGSAMNNYYPFLFFNRSNNGLLISGFLFTFTRNKTNSNDKEQRKNCQF